MYDVTRGLCVCPRRDINNNSNGVGELSRHVVRSETYRASPPPLPLPLRPQSRSALTVSNPGRSTLASGVFWVSQVSERQSKLHSLNVLSVLTRAASSSVLLVKQFTFPITIDGTEGLYFHRLAASLAFTFAPALQPRRLLFSSSGMGWKMPARPIVWSESSFSLE